MENVINAKTLRGDLAKILEQVRKGKRFTVLYRSRPVCQLVPVGASVPVHDDLEQDPLYRAEAVGRSTDGKTSADHDAVLYPHQQK